MPNPSDLSRGKLRLTIPLSLSSVELFPGLMLTVVPTSGHTTTAGPVLEVLHERVDVALVQLYGMAS